VERRFAAASPTRVYRDGKDRVEIWDADDFAPWETLRWDRVRVIRYRQHKPDQTTVQAQWLTNLPSRRVGSLSLYHLAKSRWEIENQGFNDAKNRYGLEHICHHHPNSILIGWLLVLLALVIERLYRIRYLHRGPTESCRRTSCAAFFGSAYPHHLSTPVDRNRNRRLGRCLSSKSLARSRGSSAHGKSLPENAPLAAQQLQRLDRSGLPALGSFEAHEYPKPLQRSQAA